MTRRGRLSATVEAELLAAGRAAVAQGRAENLSSWVNEALRKHSEHERRLAALDRAIAAYEAEHGVITEKEMDETWRRLKARAIVIRPDPKRGRSVRVNRRGAA